jgi:hypothetical protein
MTFDVSGLAPGLEGGADGIWFARPRASVSCPEHGNAASLQVEDRSFWFRHRNRCIASALRRFAPQGTLLDIGGSNEYVAKVTNDPVKYVAESIELALAGMSRTDGISCPNLETLR